MTSNFVETFDPPTMAITGFSGCLKLNSRDSNSLDKSGPAQDDFAYLMIPQVLACALCEQANASITKISHNFAICFASKSSFFFSPISNLTFSSSAILP